MEYNFGPNKPKFTGTDAEWNELKEQLAWWSEDSSSYPSVILICPHCGAKNIHTTASKERHRECDLMIDKNGEVLVYDCPGYSMCRTINTPN
jgi:hypothetical protein